MDSVRSESTQIAVEKTHKQSISLLLSFFDELTIRLTSEWEERLRQKEEDEKRCEAEYNRLLQEFARYQRNKEHEIRSLEARLRDYLGGRPRSTATAFFFGHQSHRYFYSGTKREETTKAAEWMKRQRVPMPPRHLVTVLA